MVTQSEASKYYINMFDIGSIYVWGFNSGTIITEASIKRAYASYGSTQYNKTYYENKLKEGKGKNGSDCSGAHYGISGYDTTAQGYYNKCKKKGAIATLPKNKVCLLFSGNSTSKITHTGVWLPEVQMVFHMKSSKENAVMEPLETSKFKNGWWGYADFISDYDTYSYTGFIYTEWVKRLQTELKVTVDGIIGKKTLAACPEIKRGRKGNIVKLLQERLNSLGYDAGEIDGIFGTKTNNAVIKFQRAKGLAADGIVGPKTWKALA